MPEDPIQILQKAIGENNNHDPSTEELLKPMKRLVDVCDAGDKISRSLSRTVSDEKPPETHSPIVTNANFPPRHAAASLKMFSQMATLRDELDKNIPAFAAVMGKLDALEKKRTNGERAITDWMRGIFPLVGLPEPKNPSLPINLIDAINQKALAFLQQTQEAEKALMKVKSDIDQAKQDKANAIRKVYDNAGYKDFGAATAKWLEFKKGVLAIREKVLALPEARTNTVLCSWGLGLDDVQKLPDGYRDFDIGIVKTEVGDLFKTLAGNFTNLVEAVEEAQPPIDKIAAKSINVSGVFPDGLVVGRVDSFGHKHDDALKGLGVPTTMPRYIDFPFASPLIYEDAGLLQMLALRMAQALPQGLFEAYAIDSENVGQTFREIAGLRKSGILTISSKTGDDERILLELDTWLGDLSDRGCWDDSKDWVDYNRKHPESPIPFKFVLFPSLAALDARGLATVLKLIKNGPASGVIAAFSNTALLSLSARKDESIAKDISEKAKQFVRLSALINSAND